MCFVRALQSFEFRVLILIVCLPHKAEGAQSVVLFNPLLGEFISSYISHGYFGEIDRYEMKNRSDAIDLLNTSTL